MNILPVAVPVQIPETTYKQYTQGGLDFRGVLNSAITKLNDVEAKADDVTQKFMVGDVQDIHQVTVAMQEAKLTMQLAVEVRNKVVEAYQEISRIQL